MIDLGYIATVVLLLGSTIALIPSYCQCNLSDYCGTIHHETANETAKKYALRTNQNSERYAAIKSNPIPVLIRVIYDSSMEAEFPEQQARENYIRNLFYGAQMIIEQPELYDQIKLHLVVISIEKLMEEFPVDFPDDWMLANVNKVNWQTNTNRSDLTVMLFYREIVTESSGRVIGKTDYGIFCSSVNRPKGVILNAVGLNRAIVLAHELGHTFDMYHDGIYGPGFSCQGKTIMSPLSGQGTWSTCSVESAKNFLVSGSTYDCLYNANRLSWATPVNEKFDFTQNSKNRRPYPGEQVSLDEQCKLATDQIARSLIDGFEVCGGLVCEIDGDLTVVGPALYGSECLLKDSSTRGRCKSEKCSNEPL